MGEQTFAEIGKSLKGFELIRNFYVNMWFNIPEYSQGGYFHKIRIEI